MIEEKYRGIATASLSDRLVDAQLDSFRVFGWIVQICFIREGCYIWMSTSGRLGVYSSGIAPAEKQEFGQLLGNLHAMIGENVSSVEVASNGSLSILLESGVVRTKLEGEVLDPIWSVTPGCPSVEVDGAWAVALTDDGTLISRP